jgi:phage shock protein PspC (stress-responsive transcriptional regulator)
MTNDLLEELRGMDQATLTEIVRKDQGCSDLELVDWKVEPLNHEKFISTTGGLFRFGGLAENKEEEIPWTVVLKCINNPAPRKQEPRGWSYWQREAMAFRSGFLEQLPTGVRAPRFYGAVDRDDGIWLWLEHIQEATGRKWSLGYFRRTAFQLGKLQGAYLSGAPLLDYPWLSRAFFRDIWSESVQGLWSDLMNPEKERTAWESPIVQQRFDDRQKSRVLKLIAEKQRFFEVNDKLPQVLCHHDAHRRNFMWSQSQETAGEELIGVDWAFVGEGAVGNDLGKLVGTTMYFFEYEPSEARALEEAVFEGYLAGLAEYKLDLDVRLARLGYLISLSFWEGAMIPGWIALLMSPDARADVEVMCGRPKEDILTGWVQLNEFCLDGADEARSLMHQLHL